MLGKDLVVTRDYATGEAIVQFRIPAGEAKQALPILDRLRNLLLDVELKPHSEKRSRTANAYAWVLIGKIAAATHQTNTAVYRQLVREIGDNFEILPVRNNVVEHWTRMWQSRGLGWICERFGESKLPGYTNTICFYGSSVYNTTQMGALVDAAVCECRELGIETLPPREIEQLLSDWRTA